jgi:hypothetical protein
MVLFDRSTRIIHIDHNYVQPLCKPLFFPRAVSSFIDIWLLSALILWMFREGDKLMEISEFLPDKSPNPRFSGLSLRLQTTRVISILMLIPGQFLKLVVYFYGSPWNFKLNWFFHILTNSGYVLLWTTSLVVISINFFEDREEIFGTLDVLVWCMIVWAYFFHNYQLNFNGITEIIITFQLIQTIYTSNFGIDEYHKLYSKIECANVEFYSDKRPYSEIYNCYDRKYIDN